MLGHSFRMSEKRIFCRKKWLINAKSRLGRHGRPIPHFTHLFFELQSVYNALHSIDIIWHVSFSAMCDNLMRLLGKSMPNLLDRCLGFCKRKLENEFLTETMKISTLTTSRKKYLLTKIKCEFLDVITSINKTPKFKAVERLGTI